MIRNVIMYSKLNFYITKSFINANRQKNHS